MMRRRRISRGRLVKIAQRMTAPPQRIIAAGPLARTARPREKPKRREIKEVEEVNEVKEVRGGEAGVVARLPVDSVAAASLGESGGKPPHSKGSRRRTAAQTMAIVNMALKGMSVAAA